MQDFSSDVGHDVPPGPAESRGWVEPTFAEWNVGVSGVASLEEAQDRAARAALSLKAVWFAGARTTHDGVRILVATDSSLEDLTRLLTALSSRLFGDGAPVTITECTQDEAVHIASSDTRPAKNVGLELAEFLRHDPNGLEEVIGEMPGALVTLLSGLGAITHHHRRVTAELSAIRRCDMAARALERLKEDPELRELQELSGEDNDTFYDELPSIVHAIDDEIERAERALDEAARTEAQSKAQGDIFSSMRRESPPVGQGLGLSVVKEMSERRVKRSKKKAARAANPESDILGPQPAAPESAPARQLAEGEA